MIEVKEACYDALVEAAKQMCLAALTAPKACGRDSIVCGVLEGEELKALAREMIRIELEVENARPIFVRDAKLVEQCAAVVLIGTKNQARGLVPCGLCGHPTCGAAADCGGHCSFDDIDLGIAIGSAVSRAADMRVDNRILYSGGVAAMNLQLLGEGVGTIMAIPVTASAQNIFFVRG